MTAVMWEITVQAAAEQADTAEDEMTSVRAAREVGGLKVETFKSERYRQSI